MRALIIGGTGFIGPEVVRLLAGRGHAVTLFHRGRTHADLPPGVNHISGDRRDLAEFRGEFKRLAPEVVLDLICYTEQEAQAAVQTFGGVAARMVTASSMDVYRGYGRLLRIEAGPPDPIPFTEDSPLRQAMYPHRAIAKASEDFARSYEKIFVERAVMSDPRLRGTILRLPAIYGPGDPHHRTFEYLKRMDDGRPAILIEETRARWRWTRGYVENVAGAIAIAVADDRAAGRIYNVGEQDAPTEAEWIEGIGGAARWDGAIVAAPKELLPGHLVAPYDWQHHIVGDTARIRNELGYAESVTREDALKKTVEWQRAHPPEKADPAPFDYAAEDAALAKIEQES
ncbi:MAG TPA: NAD-dependent epimerase/dehydratase family protein [Blastocatellia bacterium]|jgi:nucleoside-diphosphate-sugar epimerase|nr:NAD-dependent epimerase/dehydratase family protein [Blastocatellia bacterium]